MLVILQTPAPSVKCMSTTSATLPAATIHRQLPFLIAGIAYTIAGGMLAAATAFTTTEKTAWATAYIVLIGGVVQVALGAALATLAPEADARWKWGIFALFNLGNVGVLAGQLGGAVLLTDVATVLLALSLVGALAATTRGAAGASQAHRKLLLAFRILLVFLAVSMVTGVVLAQIGL